MEKNGTEGTGQFWMEDIEKKLQAIKERKDGEVGCRGDIIMMMNAIIQTYQFLPAH